MSEIAAKSSRSIAEEAIAAIKKELAGGQAVLTRTHAQYGITGSNAMGPATRKWHAGGFKNKPEPKLMSEAEVAVAVMKALILTSPRPMYSVPPAAP